MADTARQGCNLERWAWPPVPKGQWGPRGWKWGHNLAIRYPARPTVADARLAYARLVNFVNNLPCEECRYHARCYVQNNPPALGSTHTFQSWFWRFHNDVNLRIGKPFYPWERYLRDYAGEIRAAAG